MNTENRLDKAIAAERHPARENVKRVDLADVMYTHQVGDGPAKGWIHTHGLAKHGLPELEIRSVPLFLGKQAAALLEGIAAYMLNTPSKPIVPEHTMRLDGSVFRFVEASADDEAGYDSNHYEGVTRLMLIEMDGPIPCYVCEDDQGSCAAKEPENDAAHRSTNTGMVVETGKASALYQRERERLGARVADEKLGDLLREPYGRAPCIMRINEARGFVRGNVLAVSVATAKFLGRHEDAEAAIADAQQRERS